MEKKIRYVVFTKKKTDKHCGIEFDSFRGKINSVVLRHLIFLN